MTLKTLVAVAVAVISLGIGAGGVIEGLNPPTHTKLELIKEPTSKKTIYIRNLAPQFWSDKEIKNDIPAWEAAINVDFRQFWHSDQYKLVFIGRQSAPIGASVATIVDKGPVEGALAYHSTDGGAPSITVYAGVAALYGYDNSVSMTHELQELAADPTICVTNQGWPYDWIYIQKQDGLHRVGQMEGTVWAQEVSDPVEAYSYPRAGVDGRPVQISDFITPAWFNDGIGSRYDYMGLTTQPFEILIGGYAQYWDGIEWNVIASFRNAKDKAFLLGDDEGKDART